MQSILHQYKLRLTNLSQGNRSLKLSRLSARQDLDLKAADHTENESAEEMLKRIIQGKSVTLVKKLDPRSEANNLLDRRLNQIFRTVNTIHEESGAYDLYLGYPFVEGKFIDGSVARCPLVLFPVKLERNFECSPRWQLTTSKEEEIIFNKTFFLAYEKFQQIRLPKEFWETSPEHAEDTQGLLNWLYQFLTRFDFAINFNSELFTYQLNHFYDKNKDRLEQLAIGKLVLQPQAVLGIFPQSDSALLQDYEAIEKSVETFPLEQLLGKSFSSKQFQEELFSNETTSENPGKFAPLPNPYIKEENRFFVAPVDQTQEEALLKIKNGHSVVLHGPPGTGKSQVILNVVADSLAQGKKILVVSQKRAALDVVYHRLCESGLNRFAALVHDHRSDRNKIFAHIRRQVDDIEDFQKQLLNLNVTRWEHDLKLNSRRLDELNEFFEDLNSALLKERAFGLSVHELYLMANREAPGFDLEQPAKELDYPASKTLINRFREIWDYKEFFEPAHPWKDRLSFSGLGFSEKTIRVQQLKSLFPQIEALHQNWMDFSQLTEPLTDCKKTLNNIAVFREIGKRLCIPQLKEDFEKFAKNGLQVKNVNRQLDVFGNHLKKVAEFKILGPEEWKNFIDLRDHFKQYFKSRENVFRLFDLDYMRAWWYIRFILKHKNLDNDDATIGIMHKEVKVMGKLLDYYQKVEDNSFFNDFPLTGTNPEMSKWLQEKRTAVQFVAEIEKIDFFEPLKPRYSNNYWDKDAWEKSLKTLDDLERFSIKIRDWVNSWTPFLHPKQILGLITGIEAPEKVKTLTDSLVFHFESDFEDLKNLDLLLNSLTRSEKQTLEIAKADLSENSGDRETWLEKVRNGLYLSWISQAESIDPVLAEVSTRSIDQRLEEFSEKLKERQQNTVELIGRKLREKIVNRIEYNRLNNPVTYREIAHQVGKKRRIWSVRKMVDEYWNQGLATLMPCWLASPESIAAIFPMAADWFDIVVFDEASQCYVEKALPVMLRGRTNVIAGDEKQLQPFDLYTVKADESEDAFFENEMAIEVESALDLAKNVFSECKLSWHYRSREEELINFSNHAFYDGRLNVIPPAHHNVLNMPPIEWRKIEGKWRNNTNQEEAKAVITLIEELISRKDQPSIGVVTFNYHQQELIRDLLDQRLQQLSENDDQILLSLYHKAMLREDQEEKQGIFVKNIENVQGDERDIIIFSVAYARNDTGKMVTQFGLLSQRGGENRLNVAITRAKQKIYLLCSFEPEELDVSRAAHEGPRLFKKYLEYGRAVTRENKTEIFGILQSLSPNDTLSPNLGSNKNEIPPKTENEPGYRNTNLIAAAIKKGLATAGYQAETNVGDTHYKVDLAVRNPSLKDDFLLAIECEGVNYFSGKTAKEREVYRRNQLRQKGWEIHRVWARNYFLSPKKELEKILLRLEKLSQSGK